MEMIVNKFCTNCGNELHSGADVCLACGKLVHGPQRVIVQEVDTNGKSTATLALIFGILSFYPLTFIGSIVGGILGAIGMSDKNSKYRGRAKLGFWLSVGSFLLWIFLIVCFIVMIILFVEPYDPSIDPGYYT